MVLDNFEQLLPAALIVADLLHACTRLTVLVTSRATPRRGLLVGARRPDPSADWAPGRGVSAQPRGGGAR
jgi:hypothetical protein